MNGDRAQAFTLEAFFAATIILSAIVFALQASAVTPLTSSTSSQQLRTQQAVLADGFLSSTENNAVLKNAILHWNASTNNWAVTNNTTRDELSSSRHYNAKIESPEPIQAAQLDAFSQRTAVNIEVVPHKRTASGEIKQVEASKRYFQDEGRPTENTIVAEKQIVLYDNDTLTRVNNGEFVQTSTTVSEANDFYASDISPNTELYNIVTVRVTVWRI